MFEFRTPGHITIAVGWPDPELWAIPYDMGEMESLKEHLRLYERAVAAGREPYQCLASFHRAREGKPAFWAFSSPETVKFALGG